MEINIDPASIDSNLDERDKHLRGKDYLHVSKYPTAHFVSTSFQEGESGEFILKGNLTLRGITKEITVNLQQIGHGPDPWGGYRRGFEGNAFLTLTDFGIMVDLGPASRQVEMLLAIEGVYKE